jgi:hypothetical protein
MVIIIIKIDIIVNTPGEKYQIICRAMATLATRLIQDIYVR